jgi:redox-regulated HSP33 family molecular chaperone
MASGTLLAKWIGRQRHRDVLIRVSNSNLRCVLTQCTAAVNEGIRRFAVTDPRVATLYARMLTSAVMFSGNIKGEERVILQATFVSMCDRAGILSIRHSDSYICRQTEAHSVCPISAIYAEAMAIGEVRGYVHSRESVPSPMWDGLLPAEAAMSFTNVLYNAATPYTSFFQRHKGDIEGDLQHYCAVSEQLPSVVRLFAVQEPGSARVQYAGGLLAQRIASSGGSDLSSGATSWETFAQRATDQRFDMALLSGDGHILQEMVQQHLLPELQHASVMDETLFPRVPVHFHCRCSKASFTQKVSKLGAGTLAQISQQLLEPDYVNGVPLICQFCNEHYLVTAGDVAAMTATQQSG